MPCLTRPSGRVITPAGIRWLAPLLGAATLAGCGGDSGSVASTPAPTATATPSPTPTTTPAASPALIPASTFQTAEYNRSSGPAFHNAIPAWQTGASGKNVTLGIVDSGIDTNNSEFAGRISPASRDVVSTRSLIPDDDHGTQVALIAAAARDNSGIMGIAWGSTILMARTDAVGSCNTSGGCEFPNSAIAAGINLAASNGAKVINLSLGGSAPSSSVIQAVAGAAAAGVVVVVSAGNNGASTTAGVDSSNPEAFATGLRQAGNGNVIIAGSVDAQSVISSFSNRAGTEANWYLGALGEDVCCVYSGSQIKITTTGGQQFQTVVSGTSYAAPQISGAVALLMGAFPNLTANQVVQLLLSSATDAGAAGTDPIYGRGILNIANAFAPKGQTTLAGTTSLVPLGGVATTTSPAMGDAGQTVQSRTSLQAVVLDSYARAYRADLSIGLREAAVAPRLAATLLDNTRGVSARAGGAALGFTLGRDRAPAPWSGRLRLSRDPSDRESVIAATMLAPVARRTTVGFGLAQGADGLSTQLAGQDRHAFLIASDPADDLGFVRTGLAAMAVHRHFGRTGLTFSAESGRVVDGSSLNSPRDRLVAELRGKPAPFARFGLAADGHIGPVAATASVSWLREDRTVLGATFHPGLSPHGADSWLLDLGGQWSPAADWTLAAAWRRGVTHARTGPVITGGSTLVTSGWRLDIARRNLFTSGDSLALRLSQPLRVDSGGLQLLLPVSWDYATGSATMHQRQLGLAPSGREIDAELRWQGAFAGGQASSSLYARRNPGHIASLPTERGVAIAWRTGF